MSQRPIVSYGGDCSLFCGLQGSLVAALPEETVEWRRSYGRTSRFVNVEVDFVPFSEECLVKDPNRSVLQQPIFHTFWTDCTDVETYKSTVRENVQAWISQLRQHAVTDWMVVVVGAPDAKKTNKLLPRTTVLDKMKTDFGGKQAERCVSLYEPVKTDSRSMESWQALLAKMRSLVMVAFNRALNKFEEGMRGERERRTEKNWSFCSYFSVQEELAQAMLLLGVLDEALVQYDELDALLTQFVLNSAAGDTPRWLANFRQTCEKWEGLYISLEPDRTFPEKISRRTITLLELRNYLFQQQAALLLKLNRPWELASRALNFLHNTGTELSLLNISIAQGGVACWGFLSCLELLHTLARYNTPNATHTHARHVAPLWSYARGKLSELGTMCGLQPGLSGGNSEQLHTVIALVYGMGNDPRADNTGTRGGGGGGTEAGDGAAVSKTTLPSPPPLGCEDVAVPFSVAMLEQDHMTPMTRLKEALSSKESFKKHYLELSEVAISTYKHIGHVRSARLIGRDLARFYLSLDQPQQASNFLSDLLHSLNDGCWPALAADTREQLQTCYRATGDCSKLVRVSAEIACCPLLSLERREQALQEMKVAAQDLQCDETVILPAGEVVHITGLSLSCRTPVTLGSTLRAVAILHSKLPVPLQFDLIEVVLKLQPADDLQSSGSGGGGGGGGRKRSGVGDQGTARVERRVSTHHARHHTALVNRSNSGGSEGSDSSSSGRGERRSTIPEEGEEEEREVVLEGECRRLHMSVHLDRKQDGTLAGAAVVCHNTHQALSRRDSHSRMSTSAEQHQPLACHATDVRLSAINAIIPPGDSDLMLEAVVNQRGLLVCRGAVFRSDRLQLLQHRIPALPSGGVEVIQQAARLVLGRKGRDLIAGIPQHMLLTLHAGTSPVAQDTPVELRLSRGLLLSAEVWQLTEDGRRPVLTEPCSYTSRPGFATTNSAKDGTVSASDSAVPTNDSAVPTNDSTVSANNSTVSVNDSAVIANDSTACTAVSASSSSSAMVVTTECQQHLDAGLVREVRLLLPAADALSSLTLELTVLALLGPQRDTNAVDHIVSLSSPVLQQARQDVDVHFTPPFCSTAKLHTANTKKFFQVKVSGLVGECIELREPSLCLQQPSTSHSPFPLTLLNTPDQTMDVCSEQSGSYMWEVGVDYSQPDTPTLKLEFGVQYSTLCAPETLRTYRCTFDLTDYKTLFSIKSRVEPSKGSEFCRAGTMCHLRITVETVKPSDASQQSEVSGDTPLPVLGDSYDSIMYEVLADQTMWAVCGRTSGVLSVECARRRQLVTLDVMPLLGGFLPLPAVRLSKYIPADVKRPTDSGVVATASSIPRLEPFSPGQVYNFSKGTQVHVLTAAVASGAGGE